ncbi:MAG: alpha-mannosidase [Clostridia bacterium]|nr:alpha-mannosidase [Clostridia bacterium]
MEKKTLHIIPHSHWDREWYMSFEQHRMRLVELFDALIETMENHPEYNYYHMDGQYVVIEDYLEVRPSMRERLMKLIREDRIQIGPWYVLQDEYLTSGEANVRNMLYGIRLCKELGADPVMTGYFPDAFGNISQAPQILQGFGIDNAVFGRGIGTILADNMVDKKAKAKPTEIIWRAPDGSEVIGIMFARWYHNAMELSTEKEKLKKQLDSIIKSTTECAATPHLLGMNGCDHQPVQKDLHEALKVARTLYDPQEIEIKQSNFKDLVAGIRPYKEAFPLIEGEINGQRTSGSNPLICTASTHIPIKQLNHRGQNALEKIAEPLSTIAFLSGCDTYREDQLLFAWKLLMQNHPHDSICTCSCDEVAKEMTTRFDKSFHAATFIKDEALDAMVRNIDTRALSDMNITVFHTAPGKTIGTVKAIVDYPEESGIESLSVYTESGEKVPCTVKKSGRTFTYTLPKDAFRKPRYVDRFEVEMWVKAEGIGYTTYRVSPEAAPQESLVKIIENGAENETIRLKIEPNGALTITDLSTGITYRNNNIYEDLGDAGESYNFKPALDDSPITTEKDTAFITLKKATPYSVTYDIINTLELPAGMSEKKRCGDYLTHTLTTQVTLTAGVHRIDIETTLDNQAENHRLRALFMPKISADHALAEGQFDVVEREITPYHTWQNPCYCQRIQTFFGLEEKDRGLLISTRGLNEYEILRDGENTMALTLLRCVDQMGDWGYFPTPAAQCKGEHTLSYSIIPFGTANRAEAFREAYSFNGDSLFARSIKKQEGSLPASFLTVAAEGEFLPFAAFKKAEKSASGILRFYNADKKEQKLTLKLGKKIKNLYLTNLAEERQKQLANETDTATYLAPAKKIITFEIEF